MFSGILVSIATGLFSMLQPDISLGKRVGFQIIMGVGLGSGLQMVRFSPPEQFETIT
jgi:L-cystine uptake protein TcyP (sodium:dicarboxylate symporter family)